MRSYSQLHALAAGATGIGLANLILEDSTGAAIDAQTIDGRVVVEAGAAAPAPEPTTLALLASGLAVAWFRRAQPIRHKKL